MKYNAFVEKIKNNGYKITRQRSAIILSLYESQEMLVSADYILKKSLEKCSKTNLTTIYRNLEILEQIGLVSKDISENGTAMFRLRDSDKHGHYITCKICGKTQNIEFCPLSSFKEVASQIGYTLTDHKVELYGYCEKCKRKIV
jgi:Fe2+ or Zn2+ uptake regulation protein